MAVVRFSERELRCANLCVAWRFADRMTSEQFAELCRVSAEHLRSGHGEPDPICAPSLKEAV